MGSSREVLDRDFPGLELACFGKCTWGRRAVCGGWWAYGAESEEGEAELEGFIEEELERRYRIGGREDGCGYCTCHA